MRISSFLNTNISANNIDIHGCSKTTLYIRLLKYVKPYRIYFILAVTFMIFLAGIEASIPVLLKPALDGTFVDKDPSFQTLVPIGILVLFLGRGIANFASAVFLQ